MPGLPSLEIAVFADVGVVPLVILLLGVPCACIGTVRKFTRPAYFRICSAHHTLLGNNQVASDQQRNNHRRFCKRQFAAITDLFCSCLLSTSQCNHITATRITETLSLSTQTESHPWSKICFVLLRLQFKIPGSVSLA